MTRGELAKQNFLSGYNCAQSVLLAFSDLTHLDKESGMKIAASFGGGMGRLREVCGAVSGMFMVLGLLYADGDIPSHERKAAHYEAVQALAAQFREKHGSIICRELLARIQTTAGSEPERRTDQYYVKRPCGEICACAAQIMEEFIQNHQI